MNKKQIYILATGGTISAQGDEGKTLGYTNGVFKVDSLIKSIKGVNNIAKVDGEQIFNIASEDMSIGKLLILAKRINELSKLDNIDGFVITQGTDTLEESAFFLNLVVKTSKPVIVTGAMRPATSNSPDGPNNLYDAIVVASSKDSVGKGVLVVFADYIINARDVQKIDTFRPQAFFGKEFGCCGYIHDNILNFISKSLKPHTINSEFNIDNINSLPKVGIVYFDVNLDSDIFDYYINHDYKGIIIAGSGSGMISKRWKSKILEMTKNSIAVVRSSIATSGSVDRDSIDKEYRTIPSYTLTPLKARILLSLALEKSNSYDYLKSVFEKY